MLTSAGRCFSKASISGALQEVWPPTMAPTFVAVYTVSRRRSGCDDSIQGPKAFTTASMFFASTL